MMLKQVKRAMILSVPHLIMSLHRASESYAGDLGSFPSQEFCYLPFNNPIKL